MNKTQNPFFEKFNKIDKPLARIVKKKRERAREKTQNTSITNIEKALIQII